MAKEDCFAYVNEYECLALCELDCDGCSFYQTVSQLKKAREKAKKRIATRFCYEVIITAVLSKVNHFFQVYRAYPNAAAKK